MKAVIFKKAYKSYEEGDIFFVGENGSIDSWLATNWLFAEGYVTGDVIPETIPVEYLKAQYLQGTYSAYRAEHWTKEGQSDLYANPHDETWAYVQEQSAFWSIGFKPGFNEPAIAIIYAEMNAAVFSQMYAVFGTQDPDSASAYKSTWDIMVSNPDIWVAAGITARFERGGVVAGELLDTEEKILGYANACISAAMQYGIWRMQRIEQFRQERLAILAGN